MLPIQLQIYVEREPFGEDYKFSHAERGSPVIDEPLIRCGVCMDVKRMLNPAITVDISSFRQYYNNYHNFLK